MKKLMILAIVCLSANFAFAQKVKESEVPAIVKATFAKSYPGAKGVQWEKENDAFESSFQQNKQEMSVVIDAMGVVTEVETEIDKGSLPAAVQATLKKEFKDYKVEDAAMIVSAGVTTYEAEVEKGKESFDLIFDTNGKLMSKELKKEKEEKY